LAITGTPGTGKKTLAPAVSAKLGLACVGLNELLSAGERARASRGVDPRLLRKRLLRQAKGASLVYGHLVPDVLEKGDVDRVVVLRCNPSVLARRLRDRGYSASKVAGNVEAELIGVVSAACLSRFGAKRCAEFDTSSRSVQRSVAAVARLLSAARSGGAPMDWVPLYSSAEKLRSLLSVE